MRSLLVLAAFLAPLALAPLRAADACCSAPAATPTAAPAAGAPQAAAPKGHPLRGVVLSVLPERSSLLVRHEEIPGVMRAMTMLLKVDAETLANAKKDQSITATLVKKPDGWWIIDVNPVAPAAETGA